MAGITVEAHWIDLDACRRPFGEVLALLDCAERAQAERFRSERDRRRFVRRRGLLRILLARYLSRDRLSIRFIHNAFGKPALPDCDLRFNASHSHGVALYAVTWGAKVGCDIERQDEQIDIEATSALFAPGECRELARLPPEHRQAAFFRCWARKEAYVKALGSGLSHRMDGFDTSTPGGMLAGWSVASFEPQPSFHAAVAIQGRGMELTVGPYQEP